MNLAGARMLLAAPLFAAAIATSVACEQLLGLDDPTLAGDDAGSPAPDGAEGAPSSCREILERGDARGDGVYRIDPASDGGFDVLCDMTTAGGGWTITYDVDAAHFDGAYANDFLVNTSSPIATNSERDVWNAELVLTVSQSLWACGRQDNVDSYYWIYDHPDPHLWLVSTSTDYGEVAVTNDAGNTVPSTCSSVRKAPEEGYAFVALSNNDCVGCQDTLFGMYHYVMQPDLPYMPGCLGNVPNVYGDHPSPYDGRPITYPVCLGQQTSNGRFWMGVR